VFDGKSDAFMTELVTTQPPPTRDQIERLESFMIEAPQLQIEPVHHFAHGIYAREITIPAGTLLTGKVHSTEHLNIVSSGSIVVWTEDGMKQVDAPFTMVSRPGTKRVGLAITDTVWTTIHANPTNTHDLVQLEAELIIPDACAKIEQKEVPLCLG